MWLDVFRIHSTSYTSIHDFTRALHDVFQTASKPSGFSSATRILLTCQKIRVETVTATDLGTPLQTVPDRAGPPCRPREIISRRHDRVWSRYPDQRWEQDIRLGSHGIYKYPQEVVFGQELTGVRARLRFPVWPIPMYTNTFNNCVIGKEYNTADILVD